MRFQRREHKDPQRQPPMAHCSLCGGELYRGDMCWCINGAVLCRGCLGDYAVRFFAAHRRTCGEEGML